MNFINDLLLDISSQKHILLIFIFSIVVISYLIMRFAILKSVVHFFKRTSTQLDDIFIDSGFLNRISYAVPIFIVKDLIESIHRLPLHSKYILQLYKHYVLSKISWHFTISDISTTCVKENVDNVVNEYIRR